MAQTNNLDQVRAQLGSMSQVLDRHGYDSSPRRLLCPNPQHHDRNPGSVALFTGRDGKERLLCHSCQFRGDVIDVARLLGERVELCNPDPRKRHFKLLLPKQLTAIQRATRLKNKLKDDPTIAFDWMVAKRLARLPRLQARQEIVRNWDCLSVSGIARISELSDSLRDWAVQNYGLPFPLALSRAIAEVEQ